MATSKLLPRVVAIAFILLGTSQGPDDHSSPVELRRGNIGGIWLVHGSDTTADEGSQRGYSGSGGNGLSGPTGGGGRKGEDDTDALNNSVSQKPRSFRGSISKSRMPFETKDLEQAFESILGSLSSSIGVFDDDEEHDSEAMDKLLDRVFPPRLQTPPKYHGVLECLNEALNRDILNNSKEGKVSSQALARAYNFLNNPPRMLEVPELFVELRETADRRIWEYRRNSEKSYYESRGDPIPSQFLLTADELVARDAEEPRVREEEISPNDSKLRLRIINGWMKNQLRLRLYFLKQVGKLKGNVQDSLAAFDAGPDFLDVSIEDIEGLSYDAELDPEPIPDEEDDEKQSLLQQDEL